MNSIKQTVPTFKTASYLPSGIISIAEIMIFCSGVKITPAIDLLLQIVPFRRIDQPLGRNVGRSLACMIMPVFLVFHF